MPTRTSRKARGLRAKWTEEAMGFALDALKNKTMGVNQSWNEDRTYRDRDETS